MSYADFVTVLFSKFYEIHLMKYNGCEPFSSFRVKLEAVYIRHFDFECLRKKTRSPKYVFELHSDFPCEPYSHIH